MNELLQFPNLLLLSPKSQAGLKVGRCPRCPCNSFLLKNGEHTRCWETGLLFPLLGLLTG